MKFTVTKDHILNGLQSVQNIVSSRTTLPILSNVLIVGEGERLELTATDLDVTVSASVQAAVVKPGAVTVPVKKLLGIAREIGSGELELEVDDKNGVRIRGGSSYFRVNGLAAEEFPPLPQFGDSLKFSLPQDKLKGMLRRTSFAVSADETRYVLNGIFMSFKERRLTMVATDGRRLALTDDEVDIAPETVVEFIVPTKAVNELNRLLQPAGTVGIQVSGNQALFNMSEEGKPSAAAVTTKLVEGTYPNYRQVIPAEAAERIPFTREELLQALRRAEIMTSDKSNSVKLTFGRNSLSLTANTPEVGEVRESLAINYKGKDFAVAFNPVYMMDPLKALEEDEVFLELTDELSPGVIKTNGPFLYVIMPMRMS